MARCALLAAFLSLAVGCVLDPAGRCETRADCSYGLDCLQGVCAACRGDFDCSGWESCGGEGLCTPRAAACGPMLDLDCCNADADCASWDACDASHTCALRADHCLNDAACNAATFQRCDPEHHCTLQAGRCFADADCVAWTPTCDVPTNSCKFGAVPGDDILAWGTLAEGREDRIAVARATAPTKVEVGFDAGSGWDGRAFVDPITGELVYRHTGDAGGDTLRRFNRDAIGGVPGYWTYPTAPSADDEVAINAAACPMSWDRWVMQGGTGQLLYGCPNADRSRREFYRDGVATPVLQGVQEVLAWSASGCLLVRGGGGALHVHGTAPCAGAAVTTLPAGGHLAHRTTADAWTGPPGFRVALGNEVSGKDELWEIDELTAAVALVGTYPDAGTSYQGQSWEAIDSAGNLYGRAYIESRELILRRPLTPGSVSEIYAEASMPSGSNDFSAATFKPFLRLDQGSFLITTP
jgi:hypothetical protein